MTDIHYQFQYKTVCLESLKVYKARCEGGKVQKEEMSLITGIEQFDHKEKEAGGGYR